MASEAAGEGVGNSAQRQRVVERSNANRLTSESLDNSTLRAALDKAMIFAVSVKLYFLLQLRGPGLTAIGPV